MTDNRPQRILATLRNTHAMPKLMSPTKDPFRTLIVTIISQNTADRNTARAFENLSKHFEITPEALGKANAGQVEQCLKVAGLYRNKAKAIRQVSEMILGEYHGDLKMILSQPLEEARKTLMRLPGVGPKTADVVLLFGAARPTIPVDTHVNRVAKRLGLAPAKGDCEAVRESLQSLYDPKDHLAVHVMLVSHGRKHCKSRTPSCKQCPISALCPSRQP